MSKNTNGVGAPWILFLLGILVSVFWGGAVRTVLLPDSKARTLLEQKLITAVTDYKVTVQSARVFFSQGLVPVLGVSAEVELDPLYPCQGAWGIHSAQVVVPIELFKSIYQKKIIVDQIKINRLVVRNYDHLCSKSTAESTSLLTKKTQPIKTPHGIEASKSIHENKKPHQLQEAMNRALKDLNELPLKTVEIQDLWVEDQNTVLRINNIKIEKSVNHFEASFYVDVSRVHASVVDVPPVFVSVVLSDQGFTLSSKSKYKEGEVLITAASKPEDLDVKILFKNFPFRKIVSISPAIKNKSLSRLPMWIDCQVSVRLDLNFKGEAKASPCVLKGRKFKFKIQELEAHIERKKIKISPYKVSMKDLPINYILKAIGKEGLSGVFSDFGVMSGELSVENKEFTLDYSVKEASLYFSKKGSFSQQKIDLFSGRLNYSSGRVSGVVDKIALDQGVFKGDLSFNFDSKFQKGVLQTAIPEIQFSPTIQRLVSEGSLGGMSLFLRAEIDRGQMTTIKGVVGINSVLTPSWDMKGASLKFIYKNKKSNLQVRVKQASVRGEGALKSALQEVFVSKELELSKLRAKLLINQNGFEWSSLRAQLNKPKASSTLKSHGVWSEKNKKGTFKFSPGNKVLTFFNKESGLYLSASPSFFKKSSQKLQSVYDKNRVVLIESYEKKPGVIKALGQKVINSAKEIIKIKTN